MDISKVTIIIDNTGNSYLVIISGKEWSCQLCCFILLDFFSGTLMSADTVIILKCHVINRHGLELWIRRRKCAGQSGQALIYIKHTFLFSLWAN